MLPFLAYWQPSTQAEATAAPAEVAISEREPGEGNDIEWWDKLI